VFRRAVLGAAVVICALFIGGREAKAVTFTFTGMAGSYVVPSGVTAVQVDGRGARGGGSAFYRGGYGAGWYRITS